MDSNYSCSTSGRNIAINFTLTPALKPNLPACDSFWASEEAYNVFVGATRTRIRVAVPQPSCYPTSFGRQNPCLTTAPPRSSAPSGCHESKNRQSVGSALQSLSHRSSPCLGGCQPRSSRSARYLLSSNGVLAGRTHRYPAARLHPREQLCVCAAKRMFFKSL